MSDFGRIVRMHTDLHEPGWSLHEGDVIQMRSGRSYRVIESHPSARGPYKGIRWHSVVVVIDPDTISPEDVVIPCHWKQR